MLHNSLLASFGSKVAYSLHHASAWLSVCTPRLTIRPPLDIASFHPGPQPSISRRNPSRPWLSRHHCSGSTGQEHAWHLSGVQTPRLSIAAGLPPHHDPVRSTVGCPTQFIHSQATVPLLIPGPEAPVRAWPDRKQRHGLKQLRCGRWPSWHSQLTIDGSVKSPAAWRSHSPRVARSLALQHTEWQLGILRWNSTPQGNSHHPSRHACWVGSEPSSRPLSIRYHQWRSGGRDGLGLRSIHDW